MAAKSKGKAEVEVAEDDVELDELDADVEETEAKPAKKGKTSNGQPEVTFGVKDLADYLTKETGKTISTRDLRTQIRRMAREETPRVQREVVAGNRSRYDWPKGLKDPEVKAIIAAVKGGEVEAGKKEALDKLKRDKAEKKAKGEGGKKGKKNKS